MAEKARDSGSAAKAQVAPQVAPATDTPATQQLGGMSAGMTMVSMQMASGTAEPPPPFQFTRSGLMALQRTVGNRAVAAAMARVVQRVAIAGDTSETLYDQEAAGGQAGAKAYGGITKAQMERDGDTAVNVTVRIKFIRQARNTMKPRPGHPGDPKVGDRTGPKTELPDGDKAWATDTAAKAVAHWQNRLTMVGVDKPRPDAEAVNKRLPVIFKSVPIFNPAAGDTEFDAEVAVHPPGVIAGGKGNPIDAGNYYMKKNDKTYPANEDIIYAHEYGHLIGIPDEYSQNNEQMNKLIHRSAGSDAASSMDKLDKKAIELMALAALSTPLFYQLMGVMPPIAAALRKHRADIKKKMTVAAREAARSAEVRDLLTDRLTAMSETKLASKVPKTVATQTTTSFSQAGIANAGVEKVFNPAALSNLIGDTYWKALTAPGQEKVDIPGLGDVSINVQKSVFDSSKPPAKGSSALSKASKGEAAGQVGPKAKPGLPYLPAPGTLAAQLLAEVATWDGAGGQIESQITAENFKTHMLATLTTAFAAAFAPPPPGAAAPGLLKSGQQLSAKAWSLVNNAANEACTKLASGLITSQMTPLLETSVGQIRVAIAAEVDRIMTMTPAELAANPNPDPNMVTVVADMKKRLDASKSALAGTGMNPLGVSGATTPAQDVTYSYQGMMGSNVTRGLRPDQFETLVANFNLHFKRATEEKFKAEVTN